MKDLQENADQSSKQTGCGKPGEGRQRDAVFDGLKYPGAYPGNQAEQADDLQPGQERPEKTFGRNGRVTQQVHPTHEIHQPTGSLRCGSGCVGLGNEKDGVQHVIEYPTEGHD